MIRIILAAFLFCFLTALGAPMSVSHASPGNARARTIEPVKHSGVCMVQNRHGVMKMIPVEIDGRMYYGCCAGCVGKLKFNQAVRFAKDPVTGKEVDKSKAFIVGNADSTVIYFESKETAEIFFAARKSL